MPAWEKAAKVQPFKKVHVKAVIKVLCGISVHSVHITEERSWLSCQSTTIAWLFAPISPYAPSSGFPTGWHRWTGSGGPTVKGLARVQPSKSNRRQNWKQKTSNRGLRVAIPSSQATVRGLFLFSVFCLTVPVLASAAPGPGANPFVIGCGNSGEKPGNFMQSHKLRTQ